VGGGTFHMSGGRGRSSCHFLRNVERVRALPSSRRPSSFYIYILSLTVLLLSLFYFVFYVILTHSNSAIYEKLGYSIAR
jgi:hypothetical protein